MDAKTKADDELILSLTNKLNQQAALLEARNEQLESSQNLVAELRAELVSQVPKQTGTQSSGNTSEIGVLRKAHADLQLRFDKLQTQHQATIAKSERLHQNLKEMSGALTVKEKDLSAAQHKLRSCREELETTHKTAFETAKNLSQLESKFVRSKQGTLVNLRRKMASLSLEKDEWLQMKTNMENDGAQQAATLQQQNAYIEVLKRALNVRVSEINHHLLVRATSGRKNPLTVTYSTLVDMAASSVNLDLQAQHDALLQEHALLERQGLKDQELAKRTLEETERRHEERVLEFSNELHLLRNAIARATRHAQSKDEELSVVRVELKKVDDELFACQRALGQSKKEIQEREHELQDRTEDERTHREAIQEMRLTVSKLEKDVNDLNIEESHQRRRAFDLETKLQQAEEKLEDEKQRSKLSETALTKDLARVEATYNSLLVERNNLLDYIEEMQESTRSGEWKTRELEAVCAGRNAYVQIPIRMNCGISFLVSNHRSVVAH
jgi:chromosome segregation ATPase